MPQHAVDIPGNPSMSPPSRAPSPLCQKPLPAWCKEMAISLCHMVTATFLSLPAFQHTAASSLPLQERVWVDVCE